MPIFGVEVDTKTCHNGGTNVCSGTFDLNERTSAPRGGRTIETFNEAKFRELILYVSLRSEGDQWFGATKLNKLLYFIDQEAFRTLGQTISGQSYKKLPLGPVPDAIDMALRVLHDAGDAVTRTRIVGGGYPQHRTFALREPEMDMFEAHEISVIERVLEKYRGMTGTQVKDVSHDDLGWSSVEYYDIIPIGFSLISQRPLTERERAYAKELADEPEFRRIHAP